MELIKQLKQDGIAKGLCHTWQNKLRDGISIKRLIDLYVRGIDFCIKNDYPTLDFIRENFKGKCEPYGVFIDEQELKLRNVPDVVLQGDCKGMLTYGGYSVCRAFIRHNANVAIKVFNHAYITVDIFDNANLVLYTAGTNARVLVNVYGEANVKFVGNGVKVIYKNKKTY